MVKVTMTDQ